MTKELDKFKALADDKRLRIIHMLVDEELCACHLQDALGISQSGLSYQMKILVDAGIVSARQAGKWVHYSINSAGFRELEKYIQTFLPIAQRIDSSKIMRNKEEV